MLHTLKGLAATLGASELSAQAAQAEKQLVTGGASPDALARSTAQACADIGESLAGLKELVSALHAARATEAANLPSGATASLVLNAPALVMALETMVHQLKMSDMRAMQSFAELQQEFGKALGDQLAPLEAAMADLEFKQALTHCNSLIHRFSQDNRSHKARGICASSSQIHSKRSHPRRC